MYSVASFPVPRPAFCHLSTASNEKLGVGLGTRLCIVCVCVGMCAITCLALCRLEPRTYLTTQVAREVVIPAPPYEAETAVEDVLERPPV